ncbi:MAG: transcriptional regulator [Bacteroidetes bacterium]|nr:MAG: transcriptional regulator [Bacteroidota bacterium]
MLYHLFRSVRSEADLDALFQLTFTEHERRLIIERWKIFDALDRGMSQREVAKSVPCSIATVTRGAKNFRENKPAIKALLSAWRQTS